MVIDQVDCKYRGHFERWHSGLRRPRRSIVSALPRARSGQATMTPTILSPLKPLSPVASALRLSLSPVLDGRAVVDGAWWPRTRDAAAELPALITAVDQRLGRVTLRVGVYRDAWDHIPRRISARGRQVRVGWFRHADPRVITLIFSGAEPIVLLVIPPGTASAPAEAAMALTVQGTAGFALTDILAIAHLPPVPPTRTPEENGWENEGGHLIDV
ncbi:DUF5994 family protein [Nonomuraea sp. NPDC050536]|uniref:DUF5994 family protein n=1 Tax=Nonomuraea sp. NPDC050536 TaxID=3364366 RepID=UPI0037C6BC29